MWQAKHAIVLPVLVLTAAAVASEAGNTAVVGCWKKEDAAALLSATALVAEEIKESGRCLVIPPGSDFTVETRSSDAACIRLSGFDGGLWVAGRAIGSE